jgi:hypothetical protein
VAHLKRWAKKFMRGDEKMNEEELKRATYLAAKDFFAWNSGKNTPNILLNLSEITDAVQKTIDDSSRSSSELARALNKITLWYALITAVGVACTVTQVVLAFRK